MHRRPRETALSGLRRAFGRAFGQRRLENAIQQVVQQLWPDRFGDDMGDAEQNTHPLPIPNSSPPPPRSAALPARPGAPARSCGSRARPSARGRGSRRRLHRAPATIRRERRSSFTISWYFARSATLSTDAGNARSLLRIKSVLMKRERAWWRRDFLADDREGQLTRSSLSSAGW